MPSRHTGLMNSCGCCFDMLSDDENETNFEFDGREKVYSRTANKLGLLLSLYKVENDDHKPTKIRR